MMKLITPKQNGGLLGMWSIPKYFKEDGAEDCRWEEYCKGVPTRSWLCWQSMTSKS